jgi:aconitase A
MAAEYEEVWECKQGHKYRSPRGVKCQAVTCGVCAGQYGPRPKVNAGIETWSMRLVLVRNVNGRMVAA